MTTTQPIPQLTPALLTGIDTVLAGAPPFAYVERTPAEFVAWGRETGNLCSRFAHFIEQRGDLADGAPAAFVRLSHVGGSAWFMKLDGEQRKTISRTLLGERTFEAYHAWVVSGIAPAFA